MLISLQLFPPFYRMPIRLHHNSIVESHVKTRSPIFYKMSERSRFISLLLTLEELLFAYEGLLEVFLRVLLLRSVSVLVDEQRLL